MPQFLFETPRLRRIVATAAPANLASHRVQLKAGLRRAERVRHDDGSSTQRFEWRAGASGAAP